MTLPQSELAVAKARGVSFVDSLGAVVSRFCAREGMTATLLKGAMGSRLRGNDGLKVRAINVLHVPASRKHTKLNAVVHAQEAGAKPEIVNCTNLKTVIPAEAGTHSTSAQRCYGSLPARVLQIYFEPAVGQGCCAQKDSLRVTSDKAASAINGCSVNCNRPTSPCWRKWNATISRRAARSKGWASALPAWRMPAGRGYRF